MFVNLFPRTKGARFFFVQRGAYFCAGIFDDDRGRALMANNHPFFDVKFFFHDFWNVATFSFLFCQTNVALNDRKIHCSLISIKVK